MTNQFVVLLGAPGAGKGTQAKSLAKVLGVPHVSSGDIFRANLKKKTELGKLAEGYISRGQLVPDDITVRMVQDRLDQADCEAGYILDGFPRTPEQADALDRYLETRSASLDAVLYIDVSKAIVIERLGGRWMCRAEGHVYHAIYNPPRQPGICDIDGSELYQREDDQPATVVKRLDVYRAQTAPLIEYYRERGLLKTVNGDGSIEDVGKALLDALRPGKEDE